jgi:hypothetical protein
VSGRQRAVGASLGSALLGLTLTAPGAAAPADSAAELARCAAITASEERLACYDARACAGIVAADQRLACYDALAEPKPSRPRTAPVDATRPASSDSDAKSFGLSKSQLPATPEGPKLINARVTQVTVDRLGNVRTLLDNGQSWTFNDPDALLKPGDSVTIRRAALGSFLLTAGRRSYRAQRLQ